MKRTPEQKAWDFDDVETFDTHSQAYWTQAGETFLELLRDGVQQSGDKQGAGVAQDVGVEQSRFSQFSEALAGKPGRHFSAKWLPRAIHGDRQDRALRYLAALRGYELTPKPVKSPEEKLREVVEAALKNGRAGLAVLEDAFGPETQSVVRALLGSEQP